MTGAIPPQFGSFTNLKYLSLNDNSLTGQIPRGLGYLLHLTHESGLVVSRQKPVVRGNSGGNGEMSSLGLLSLEGNR